MKLTQLVQVAVLLMVAGCEAPLTVGVAVTDISPSEAQLAEETFYLGGYGGPFARRPTGIHDALNARAMAIESGTSAIILVALDLPGLSNHARSEIVDLVTAQTGLDKDRVLVGSTHSHGAPDLQGIWGGVPLDYRAAVITGAADAAVQAYASRREATLRAASGTADNHNRRGWDLTDDTFTALDAVDAKDARIGTVVSFGAHPVVLSSENTLISRDFIGATVDSLEAELGAPVVYFNGIQGDILPVCPEGAVDETDEFVGMNACGEAYASQMLVGMSTWTQLKRGPVVVSRARWEQEVENTAFQLAFGAGLADYDTRTQESEGEDKRYFIDLGAASFSIGDDFSGLAFPGEPLTRLGLPLKDAMPGKFKLFLGLTTDSTGYYVPLDEWKTGRNNDYEEGVSLGEQAGERASQAVREMLQSNVESP